MRKIEWLFLNLYEFPNLCHNIHRVQASLVSIYTFHFMVCAIADIVSISMNKKIQNVDTGLTNTNLH